MNLQVAEDARYYGALDGLRALSVLAVVWNHARPMGLSAPLASRGYLGVDVFFVISGFLITMLLLREEQRHGNVRLGSFWARRALRLWPLWYGILITLSALFLFVLPNAAMAKPFWRDLPWNATYTSNFIVPGTFLALSWSLALEEQFYLVWPPIVARLRSAAAPVLLFLGGLSVALHLGLFDGLILEWFGRDGARNLALRATLLPFVLGCSLALAPGVLARLARPALALPWLLVLLGCAALPDSVAPGQIRLGAQVAAAGLVAACVGPREPRWLSVRPLRWIGERAYGVYLLHLFCLQLVTSFRPWNHGERDFTAFALVALVSLGAAGLSYRFIERPFLQLKDRFRRGTTGRR
ncbi:O-acetyltransferase OatA [Planctomycetes bacterium Poly30]|uniref:O-acetyltransferase OatA n=1 Tax=Saltatorellus ferox TaxID=2528018 RepID=A0A518ELI1_9BACT|nr:O-acetyltransferase OatA [Planctomycetes bacterium Poly30]